MNRFFSSLAAGSVLAGAVLAFTGGTPMAASEGKAPLMVSPADVKWTELAERKGMQFAVLSGDPKGRPEFTCGTDLCGPS